MKTTPDESASYHFDLPERLIAAYPPAQRGDSRLLVVQPGPTPGNPRLRDLRFADLPRFFRPGDLLISNDTRVSYRRVRLRRSTGANIEALFLNPLPGGDWLCLVRGLKKLRPGEILQPARTAAEPPGAPGSNPIGFQFLATPPAVSESSAHAILSVSGSSDAEGNAVLRAVHAPAGSTANESNAPLPSAWETGLAAETFFQELGEVPIPPYLGRRSEDLDRDRYQTVYARNPASVAAPTAGLHFTDTIIEEIKQTGAAFESLELRIGYGTFAPLTEERFRTNRLHSEQYSISLALAERLNQPGQGRRIAVGTTTLRALEANRRAGPEFTPGTHATDLFLRPPDRITTVDALITNFHLPGSSLLMLVACMLDRDDVLAAYRHAVQQEYRFFSYGDAMLVCGPAFCS